MQTVERHKSNVDNLFREVERANKRHANRDRQLALLDLLGLIVEKGEMGCTT